MANMIFPRQMASGKMMWQDYNFVLHADNRDYDYLAVYNDLPEPLAVSCPPENTIHISPEPPCIARYEDAFLAQFGSIITQDANIRHPRRIFSHGGLLWFIGANVAKDGTAADAMPFVELEKLFDKPKKKLISVITSTKATHDGHAKRLRFVHKLKKHFGQQLDVYGRGINPVKDKSEAMVDYRFHVVLENSSCDHYFTEKITDCFIAGCYPMYYGCPNIGDYYPENSYLPIDIDDFATAVKVIENAIANDYDQKYRQQLRQARDMTMYEHNIYPLLVRIINELESGKHGATPQPVWHNGHILPRRHRAIRTPKLILRKGWYALLQLITLRVVYRSIRKRYLLWFHCKSLIVKSG